MLFVDYNLTIRSGQGSRLTQQTISLPPVPLQSFQFFSSLGFMELFSTHSLIASPLMNPPIAMKAKRRANGQAIMGRIASSEVLIVYQSIANISQRDSIFLN